ncbi:MAG: feruloyl-CoA synthase [Acidobacteriia bacterium]|nr:feruloyl-CoA synthase [Terriglobia bacterium]
MKAAEQTRVRPVRLGTSGASLQPLEGGGFLVQSEEPLGPYPRVLTDRLVHWAGIFPERTFAARRDAGKEWRPISYREALDTVRRLGQALLDRGLSPEHPVAVLSENDLEHLLIMLAAQHVGIPMAHLSPLYSLASRDFSQLRHVMKLLTPGLVFVSSGERYQRAIEACVSPEAELAVTAAPLATRKTTTFAELAGTQPTAAVEAAHDRIDPDDPAKILFTSGSTGFPKGVINTHRMICSNQQMIAQVFGFLEDEPPVLMDWLPWNHTFGGNHNTGIALYHGGTLYIDEGKPAPGLVEETVRNLREISPTFYLNVPKGYEELLPFLRGDRALREKFFSRLKLLFYAGAGLSQPVWDAYRKLALETCGERVIMVTGLGSTETAPMAMQSRWETEYPGVMGIPVPGVQLKLTPQGHKLEARFRGPNITPGYWRQPELTQRAFDEEGFYKIGDAVRFIDHQDVNKGFLFDGRLSEDFKLSTGTWVSVGPLRTRILAHFSPLVRDVVIAGHDRDEVGILIFADVHGCRSLCRNLAIKSPDSDVLGHEAVRAHFRALVESFAAQSTGSSNRVSRAIILEEPPSLDAGEMTEKGSLNQRAVLDRRRALVEELYESDSSPRVLRIQNSKSRRKS